MRLVDFVLDTQNIPRVAQRKKRYVYTDEQREELVARIIAGESITAIAQELGVRYQAIYQVTKELVDRANGKSKY